MIAAVSRIVLACSCVGILSSCSVANRDEHGVQELGQDVPLSEFILGRWESESAINYEGRESAYAYEMVFEDSANLKFIVLSHDGEFLEGAVSKYRFLDSRSIFVNNQRIQGGELWVLERDGKKLIVHRTIEDRTDHITFRRSIPR